MRSPGVAKATTCSQPIGLFGWCFKLPYTRFHRLWSTPKSLRDDVMTAQAYIGNTREDTTIKRQLEYMYSLIQVQEEHYIANHVRNQIVMFVCVEARPASVCGRRYR